MTNQALSTMENTQQNDEVTNGQNSNSDLKTEDRLPVFRPQVDLVDSGDAITLWADLPGVDENLVDITVENKTLTLKATVSPPEFEGKKLVLGEYRFGHYERTFSISDEIDRENIEAVVTQGVLKLVLPKNNKAISHKVTVKAG
ncbi:MAG: Hsp20/alpha crystallin family protein [Planctomycetaceae bacterium]|nr:Hsp20/alpha crystallin family protein [Planctomycetaceae bacterium]